MHDDLAKWHFLLFFMIYFYILGPKLLVHWIEPNAVFRQTNLIYNWSIILPIYSFIYFNHSFKMSYVENRDPQSAQPHDVPNFPKDHEKETIENSFPKRTMKILGILQIISGVLVIGLQVCKTQIWFQNWQLKLLLWYICYFLQILPYFIISTGTNIHSVIWDTCTGIIFIASGIIGFNNGFKPSKNGLRL